MPALSLRLVLDTNIIVRAFVDHGSRSGQIVDACLQRKLLAVTSRPTLREYRAILGAPSLKAKYPQLNRSEVDKALDRLIYVSDRIATLHAKFNFDRDHNDEHLIELAIAGEATHLISLDNDLLSLPTARTESGRAFRRRLHGVKVVEPRDFVRQHVDIFAVE